MPNLSLFPVTAPAAGAGITLHLHGLIRSDGDVFPSLGMC